MFELPEHLASLNTLAPSNSAAPVDQSAEDAVWEYFNTDALFQNFGVNPSEYESKLDAGASGTSVAKVDPRATLAGIPSTPAVGQSSGQPLPADLKSFIEQFATTTETFGSIDYANALALGLHMTTPIASTANMSDILASTPDDKPSGAKKLKQLGAGQVEIEEDKRRRNTEASARFRAKKKEREQALELRASEWKSECFESDC